MACLHRHGSLSHYCWWNKHVANPIKKFGYVGKGRKAMLLLKREILTKILLRRTKVQCADVLALPPRSASDCSSITCCAELWLRISFCQISLHCLDVLALPPVLHAVLRFAPMQSS